MQSEALFEEMRGIMQRITPDVILFVMDATTGQSAGDQARAFRETVDVGGVIITKMDGAAKGGATLSAVAATSSPVQFIGTGVLQSSPCNRRPNPDRNMAVGNPKHALQGSCILHRSIVMLIIVSHLFCSTDNNGSKLRTHTAWKPMHTTLWNNFRRSYM